MTKPTPPDAEAIRLAFEAGWHARARTLVAGDVGPEAMDRACAVYLDGVLDPGEEVTRLPPFRRGRDGRLP